jgi:arylsulfatase A-like enzyme
VRTDDWKYIRGSDGSAELFDLGSDPAESTNLVNDRPDVARKLDERLDSEFDPLATLTNSLSEVEESARRNLEDLGYI